MHQSSRRQWRGAGRSDQRGRYRQRRQFDRQQAAASIATRTASSRLYAKYSGNYYRSSLTCEAKLTVPDKNPTCLVRVPCCQKPARLTDTDAGPPDPNHGVNLDQGLPGTTTSQQLLGWLPPPATALSCHADLAAAGRSYYHGWFRLPSGLHR